MPTSDEELTEQATKVEALRAEVAQVEADRIAREADSSNDVAMLQLQAEQLRLEAQLVTAKAREDAITSGDYVDAPLASAQAELRLAVAQQDAAQAAAEGRVPEAPDPVVTQTPVVNTPPVTPPVPPAPPADSTPSVEGTVS